MAWRRHLLKGRVAARLAERRKVEQALQAEAEAQRRQQETFTVGTWVSRTGHALSRGQAALLAISGKMWQHLRWLTPAGALLYLCADHPERLWCKRWRNPACAGPVAGAGPWRVELGCTLVVLLQSSLRCLLHYMHMV